MSAHDASGRPPASAAARRPGLRAPWADRYGWLAAAAVGTAAFCTACRLGPPAPGGSEAASVTAAVFGQARHAFGTQLYMTADRYFHRGVPAVEERALNGGLFARLYAAVSPSGHAHLSGAGVREMLPWLWLSLKMDPANVETHRVAAFWLMQELRRPDLARQVLDMAGRSSAFSYQVKLDQGRLALRTGDTAAARAAFSAALAFWPRRQGVDEELARYERADILMYVALLDEMDGRTAAAAARLGEVLSQFPDRPGVRERMEALRAGRAPATPAATIWEDMIRRYSAGMGACHRGGEDDGHEDHDQHGEEAHSPHGGDGP